MALPSDEVARPIWVSEAQFEELVAGTRRAMSDARCNTEQCRALLYALTSSAEKDSARSTTIAMVVHHLRLIPGSFPVMMSDRDIRMLLTYGRISHGLSTYLSEFLPLADNRWRHE